MWEGLLGEDQIPRRTGIQANDGLRDRYLTLAFDISGHCALSDHPHRTPPVSLFSSSSLNRQKGFPVGFQCRQTGRGFQGLPPLS